MTLFATLAAAAAAAEGGDASDPAAGATPPSPSSSSSPPTAVQLYATSSVDFLTGTMSSDDLSDPRTAFGVAVPHSPSPSPRRGSNGSMVPGVSAAGVMMDARRKFEVLSYQAVEALDPAASAVPGVAVAGAVEKGGLVRLPGSIQARWGVRKHTRPNLGVWDCRISGLDGTVAGGGGGGDGDKDSNNGGGLVDKVLAGAIPSNGDGDATFIFTVDLADPQSVYPAVDAMISAVVRLYSSVEDANCGREGGARGTTQLSKLRGASFGSAPFSSPDSSSPSVPPPKDAAINLVLAVILPSARSKKVPTFRDKQAQALVLYHLHRLAERADCTLAFVRADGEKSPIAEGEEGKDEAENAAAKGGTPSMTVSELAWAVRRVASGMNPVEEEEAGGEKENQLAQPHEEGDTPEGEVAAPGAGGEAQPPIYPPGSHDPDVIGTVLLRNASCPGEWDASTDDLWKALLPPLSSSSEAETTPAKGKKGDATGGDQMWLSTLAESVSAATAGGGDDSSAATAATAAAIGEKALKSARKSAKKKKVDKEKKKGDEGGDGDAQAFFANLLKK